MSDSNNQGNGEPDESIYAFWAEAMDHGHEDLLTQIKHNFDGTRCLTASSDHRIKVYHTNPQTDKLELDDTWTAHDAEVRDVSLQCLPFILPEVDPNHRPTGEDTSLARTSVP
jgi:WD40 repeat protein